MYLAPHYRPILVLYAVTAFATSSAAQSPRTEPTISIRVSPEANERLFLLRVVDGLYEGWPTDSATGADFAKATTDLRAKAVRDKEHINAANLDPELSQLFSDYINALDAYRHFLENIGKIETSSSIQEVQDATGSGYKSGFVGGSTFAVMKHNGYSNVDSAGAALVTGLVQYLFDAWQKESDRDHAKKQAVMDEVQTLTDQLTAAYAAQHVADTLSERHGWMRGETGFELTISQSTSQEQEISDLLSNDDAQGLLQIFDEQVRTRPS